MRNVDIWKQQLKKYPTQWTCAVPQPAKVSEGLYIFILGTTQMYTHVKSHQADSQDLCTCLSITSI